MPLSSLVSTLALLDSKSGLSATGVLYTGSLLWLSATLFHLPSPSGLKSPFFLFTLIFLPACILHSTMSWPWPWRAPHISLGSLSSLFLLSLYCSAPGISQLFVGVCVPLLAWVVFTVRHRLYICTVERGTWFMDGLFNNC